MKKIVSVLLALMMLLSAASFAAAEEDAALPAIGETVEGFTVKEVRDFPLVGGTAVLFEHDRTGAELMYIANDDTNRVFDLTFFTRAIDNTGLPHVFEHATLNGSEKYPSTALFFNLSYQTYNTFMNAMTYPLMTTYPVASLSEAQLLRYADFYTDSCLHPSIMTDESIYREEAWRYRLPSEEEPLTIEGTVYSEMLGALSLESVAFTNLLRAAFPGSTIGNVSGGDPEYIPDMTWDALKAYHDTYYHPSNCVAFLYGRFEDYTAFLKLLDEAFAPYERKETSFGDPAYTPLTGPVEMSLPYPVEASSGTEHRSVVYDGFVCPGLKENARDEMVLNTLTDVLIANASPLMQKLKDALPTGSYSCSIDTDGPEMLVMTSFSLVFSLFYLSSINVSLALIIFSCSPLLVFITILVRKKHIESSRKARRSLAQINSDVNSSVSGIRITKAFNNSDREMEKFEVGNKAFVEAKRGQYFTMAIQHAATIFVTDIFNVVCLISGGIFLYKGLIGFGDYSTFIVSVSFFTSPILQLVQWMEQFDEGVTGFERFCEILDLPEETDREGAKPMEKVNGDIRFDDVCFSYNHEESREVLDHISFEVPKGKTVALVGPSGGGKTTICHLLPKFYHPDSGAISIDGIDIEEITMESLRENIGIVQQDVFLFSGSFSENIAYGKKDASEEDIISAAKKANIYDYIMSLPDTFDTQIGERGIRLSGGQKQRLSIARVFLKNPSILILDEATSSLDNTTEALIQEALNSLKQGRTTIVVAHRLSTIKNADEILVVANGKIRESGTHDELIAKENGIYKKLYDSQFLDSDFGLDAKMMMS